MSTETIDSRSLLKNVTVPDISTSVPIHNQQRVAILREDIKDLNDKVNILTGETKEVISLKEIADRLTVSSNGESSLKLQVINNIDGEAIEIFEVTPKNTSTTYECTFNSAEGFVGLKSVTQKIEAQITGLQESTNIIIDKSFLNTDGNIDLTATETYFGTKKANITAIIDDTINIDLDHSNLGTSTSITVHSSQENAIGMKEVIVTPKLSELTVQSAMLSTTNEIEITPQTIDADSQAIGFNKVKLPIKEVKECSVQLAVSTFSTVSDDIIFVKNEDDEALIYSSEIKPTVTSNVLDSVILINNSPKSFDYVLSRENIDLLTQVPESGRAETLTIKSIDTQNCLQSITIPRFEKQTLEINSSEIKDALVKAANGNNLQQITKTTPDGILYDQVIIQMPVLENPTFSKGLGSLFFIKTEEQNLVLSIADTDLNSSSTNIPLIQSFNIASYNMGDVENAKTQIEANTTTVITDNFKTYSSNVNKFLATQTKQNERILLVDNSQEQTLELKLKNISESFNIKVEQQQANSDQKKELFTISYPGRQIKITGTALEEMEAPVETITFANTFFKKFNYNLATEDNTSSIFSGYRYPKFILNTDGALTELTYSDDLNSQVDFDNLENNIEILSKKGITLATLDSDANYAPTFFVSATCERQNEVIFSYSIEEDESLISTDTKASQIISESLNDDVYNCKILKTITYDGLTYKLTKTSTDNIDFIGTYTAVVEGLEDGYVYDFIVTEDTISFYALSRYEEVENTEDTTN